MKAHTIVFHGDLFEVELTKQEEFLFRIDDGDAVAADILSRKDAVALIEWLRYHLAQPEEGVIYRMEQCARHMGRPIIHQAACYPAIRTVCPNCQEERRDAAPHASSEEKP